MKRLHIVGFFSFLLAGFICIAMLQPSRNGGQYSWKVLQAVAAATQSPCPSYTALSPTVPVDMTPNNSQANANCFAWQEFIALNWAGNVSNCSADTSAQGSTFGTPLDSTPKVWELYKQDTEIFLPGAAAPTAWCSQSEPVPAKFRSLSAAQLSSAVSPAGGHPKLLSATSKDADDPQVKLTQCAQAGASGPCGQSGWLTAQSGIMALYEIRVNKDEFSYIDSHGLYNAVTQQKFVQKPGINLPDGTAQGSTGSIELKASWLELDDPAKWPYYKTSKAMVIYPGTTTPKLVTVGLVGLHIIHKTPHSPQLIWATFEHVNNAPSITDISNKKLLSWYTFYNAACNPQTDHYQCAQNAQIAGYSPSSPYFPSYPSDPYSSPIQVVRQNPLSSSTTDNIVAINSWAQGLIASANPNSVFKNYELVDVLWAQNPTPISPASPTPLPLGNPQPNPDAEIVANTTLETYMQNTNTCLGCHIYAPIASTSSANSHTNQVHALLRRPELPSGSRQKRMDEPLLSSFTNYASDYSFLFSSAQMPSSRAAQALRMLKASGPQYK
ncbi:hypothetical protein GOB94_06325 [Granulicella sp. 5B5]|uniref:hypothetical protein n=1 Tax=Granulicella sp. 5B5 TaxID=1617967 RepID=UPI0015F63400|nr:hypothetical protein [Granulicella sp. 5B5]QMV18344.1 hypothetical protein GOB94_06325 [Granulicella sp. 5B5]